MRLGSENHDSIINGTDKYFFAVPHPFSDRNLTLLANFEQEIKGSNLILIIQVKLPPPPLIDPNFLFRGTTKDAKHY